MLTDGTEARATGVSPAELSPFESRSEISWREPDPHIGGRPSTAELTCLEICAGGGGQSLSHGNNGFGNGGDDGVPGNSGNNPSPQAESKREDRDR